MSGAQCGDQYGAVAQYCYAGATNWWFKEAVTRASGTNCSSRNINQQTQPFQNADTCINDRIFDSNGPPSNVAPCTDTTTQTVFAGPTQADVERCRYPHTQVIRVTATRRDGAGKPTAGKVTTSIGDVSTACDWTA